MVESLAQLKVLEVYKCNVIEKVVVVTKITKEGSVKKISFPKLESLSLDNLPKLRRFCEANYIECPSLLELEIKECLKMRICIPNSESTPMLTAVEEENENRDMVAQQPLLIETDSVSKTLKHVLFSEMNFKNLVKLKIFLCNNFEYLLPLDIVESLAQLKVLKVSDCNVIEEVVVVTKNAKEEESFKRILFPKLESLSLKNLPKLRKFCEANCIECPSLLKLKIWRCPKLRSCISNSASTPMLTAVEEENENGDMVAEQPLLIEKVAFPNLEELILDGTMIEIVTEKWPSQSSVVPFPKLQRLDLICSEDRNQGVFSFDIDNYQNLESVNLGGFSCIKKLWQHRELGEAEEYGGRTHTRLKELYLERLPMLMDLFEDPEDFQTFQNLKNLGIRSCGRLKTLSTSSSAYFQNLLDLRVSECHGMINLLSSSAAKSLVYLRIMIITECNQMREVIVDKDDEADSEIVFSRLETLGLHCLPSLQSFNYGNSKIQFPELKKVIVSECSQMETFSRGTVITPKLDTVIAEILEEEWQWLNLEQAKCIEGDLNSSVRKVWENDILTAVQGLFPEMDDQNVEGDTAHAHQDIHEIN